MGNGAYKYNTRCEFKIKRTNTLNKLHIGKKAIFRTSCCRSRQGPTWAWGDSPFIIQTSINTSLNLKSFPSFKVAISKISGSDNCRCIFGPRCFPEIQRRLWDVSQLSVGRLNHASITTPHESEKKKGMMPSETVTVTLTIHWINNGCYKSNVMYMGLGDVCRSDMWRWCLQWSIVMDDDRLAY